MKTIDYTSYDMVPWHHKNWFAIVTALIFAPALLVILLTGDVYYTKKSELKKYSKGAKIALIIWSILATLQLVSSVGKLGLEEFKGFGLFKSQESSFMQSMNGRWSQNKEVMNLVALDKNLLMSSDESFFVMTPSGKFDSANKILPVSTAFYKLYKTKDEVVIDVAMAICPNFAMVYPTAVAMGMSPDNFIGNCLHDLSESGQLTEALRKTKESMHKGILGSYILYNGASDDKVKFSLKKDDGTIVYNTGFVREVTPEEIKAANSYPTTLAASFTIVDSAIDEIPAYVKRNNDASATAAKELAARNEVSQIIYSSQVIMNGIEIHSRESGSTTLSADNAWGDIGLTNAPGPTNLVSEFKINKAGNVIDTTVAGVLGATPCSVTITLINGVWTGSTTCPEPAPTAIAAWNKHD